MLQNYLMTPAILPLRNRAPRPKAAAVTIGCAQLKGRMKRPTGEATLQNFMHEESPNGLPMDNIDFLPYLTEVGKFCKDNLATLGGGNSNFP